MPTVVQRKNAQVTANPATITFDSAPTQGNLLLCVFNDRTAINTAPTITGWTSIVTGLNASNSPSLVVLGKIAGASESATVSVTNSGSSSQGEILEISGGASYASVAAAIDSSNGAHGGATTATTITTGTLTPAASVYLVSAVGLHAGYTGTPTAGTGWTLQAQQAGGMLTADRSGVASTSYSDTFTWATARRTATAIVAVKNATAKSLLSPSRTARNPLLRR